MMKFNEEVFDEFPLLETERLILREITLKDIDVIYGIRSDSEVMKYFGHNVYTSFREAEEMINAVTDGFKNREGIRWGIELKGMDELVGSAGIWRLMKQHLRGEIGYDLSQKYWQRGIMYESLTAIIDFGFKKMNLHSIEANLDPDNIASAKLLEKLGFEKEGHIKESYLFNGKFTDTGIYSLIKKVN